MHTDFTNQFAFISYFSVKELKNQNPNSHKNYIKIQIFELAYFYL